MRIDEITPGVKRNLHRSIKFNEIWNRLIIPNCSEIIDIYKSSTRLLHRSTNTFQNRIFRGSSRNNRTPLDSYLSLSELFDLGLKRLGMTALRSNSIFVSNNRASTFQFGHDDYIPN